MTETWAAVEGWEGTYEVSDNLRYDTHAANIRDAIRHGTFRPRGRLFIQKEQ